MTIGNFADRLKLPGLLYVDVYPFFINEEGKIEFLIFQRRDDVALANSWQPVCGTIVKDEPFSHAFVRQVKTKTGQIPCDLWKLAMVNVYYDDYYDTVMLVPTAFCRLKERKVVIDDSLHKKHKWVTNDEAKKWLVWPQQCNCVERIQSLLTIPDTNHFLSLLKLSFNKIL